MTAASMPMPTTTPTGSITPEPDPALVLGLAALADPTRLRILAALRAGHESCREIEGYVGIHVSDLARQLEMTQPAVSQHLARLRQAGLVAVTRKGQFAYYLRDEPALDRLRSAMTTV